MTSSIKAIVFRLSSRSRRVGSTWLLAPLCVGIFWLAWSLHYSRYESTDDAHVDGEITGLGSRLNGVVSVVHAATTKRVKRGELLSELDTTDLKLELSLRESAAEEARTKLAEEELRHRILAESSQAERVEAAVSLAKAHAALTSAKLEATRSKLMLRQSQFEEQHAAKQLERGKQLLASRALPIADFEARETRALRRQSSREILNNAVSLAATTLDREHARLREATASQEALEANLPRRFELSQARVKRVKAQLQLREAELQLARRDLSHTQIRSPVDGIVVRKSIATGDRVSKDQRLFLIASVDKLWVTANFRETQTGPMRVGDRVELYVDSTQNTLIGCLENIGGATGSRVSLFPPENASANFVKVVQRIPVRIALVPNQPGEAALRIGMSVVATVHLQSAGEKGCD